MIDENSVRIRLYCSTDAESQQLAGAMRKSTAGVDARVQIESSGVGEVPFPVSGDAAVIVSLALPSLAFVANAVKDILIDHLKARSNASVEIETPDGHKIKIIGPEATSEKVLAILQELENNKSKES